MHKQTRKLKTLIGILICIGLYWLNTMSGRYSIYVLPTLNMIWESFVNLVQSGQLYRHVIASLQRILIGYGISFILAMGISLLGYFLPRLKPYYAWLLEFMRNVPPLSLIPLLILWFGIGETSKIIIIILASFFPMFLNISKGLEACGTQRLELAYAFGLNKKETFQKIVLPSALGDILVGMRIGMGYSYRAIIGAEMIAASSGLGYMINFARSLSRTDTVIVGILIIGILGYLSDRLFQYVIRKVIKNSKMYEAD
ncbi:MAG: ABC transporter permease [Erysipelotrichaceae bacterium]|nr:ABC transporter permease [Erysipelotrichaceae bacterium]